MKKWNFKFIELQQAYDFYLEFGYVGFSDLITNDENALLCKSFDDALISGIIQQGQDSMIAIDDAVHISKEFMEISKHGRIIEVLNLFLNSTDIELQHSKINSKPLNDGGSGEIDWHQDFPFFPHTNFDLIAVGIHLDDEDNDSGSLRVLPKSHKLGLISHCDSSNNFIFKANMNGISTLESELLTCSAGTITIHNCLTLHQSARKANTLKRRLLVNQYRTNDNTQLGGPIWRCTGLNISGDANIGKVRFADGTIIENRGKGGRLFDIYGKLKPKN